MSKYLLAIDQGTTSSRAILFCKDGKPRAKAQQEFPQHFPQDGWVEHDPEDIWQSTLSVCRKALKNLNASADDVIAIGITNQRETTVVWDRKTGEPIYNAIVWQDRRTADRCREMKQRKLEAGVTAKTGLLLDPYFSATKISWILDNVEGARDRAERGELAFGTIDCFLLWRLTGGQRHATDASNASRTALFDIHSQQWCSELLEQFNVPKEVLPEVLDNCADFGSTDSELFGAAIPVTAMVGDQQGATVGQACFEQGMIKSTYGTGCFMMVNTGQMALKSHNRLLTTVAYRIKGRTTYALEGSIFVAGAAVQWLRDAVGLVGNAEETEKIAASVKHAGGVYLVPAFTGLGAPYWDPDARGALIGMTRDTGSAEIVRATLESVAYQTRDLLEAMGADGVHSKSLRVDGGMVGNNWMNQFLADQLNTIVERPEVAETTALGAAYLAGLQAGVYASLDEIAGLWRCDERFTPGEGASRREANYAGWQKAVERVRL